MIWLDAGTLLDIPLSVSSLSLSLSLSFSLFSLPLSPPPLLTLRHGTVEQFLNMCLLRISGYDGSQTSAPGFASAKGYT